MKADATGVVHAEGGCNQCGRKWEGLNAMAQAARHAEAKRHPTWARSTIYATWLGAPAPGQPEQLTLGT